MDDAAIEKPHVRLFFPKSLLCCLEISPVKPLETNRKIA